MGRGRYIYIFGNRRLRRQLLQTSAAKALGASPGWLYPSDHLAFRASWKAVTFARADRLWFLDLRWVHSRGDEPSEIALEKLAEAARIVEEFVQEIAAGEQIRGAKIT